MSHGLHAIPILFLIWGVAYLAIYLDNQRVYPRVLGYDEPSMGVTIGKGVLILTGVPLSCFILMVFGLVEADWRFIPLSGFATIVLLVSGYGILRASREDETEANETS